MNVKSPENITNILAHIILHHSKQLKKLKVQLLTLQHVTKIYVNSECTQKKTSRASFPSKGLLSHTKGAN